MIFGNLSVVFSENMLRHYDRIFINGHLSIWRNNEIVNKAIYMGSSKQSLRDICATQNTIAYDEMNGMKLIFKENGLRQYINRHMFVDILPGTNMVNNDLLNLPNQYYMWEKGQLWWCISLFGRKVKLRKIVYIHLQKRIMRIHIDANCEKYYIYDGKLTSDYPNESNLTNARDIIKFIFEKVIRGSGKIAKIIYTNK